MMNYLKVGSYTKETDDMPEVIEREFYGQGYIFMDEEAFLNHYDKPCYAPELHDSVYTKQDFIDLCGGREDFATICFESVDWQSPETWVDEQFTHGEWDDCPKCERWYSRHSAPEPCAQCGEPLEYVSGRSGDITENTKEAKTINKEIKFELMHNGYLNKDYICADYFADGTRPIIAELDKCHVIVSGNGNGALVYVSQTDECGWWSGYAPTKESGVNAGQKVAEFIVKSDKRIFYDTTLSHYMRSLRLKEIKCDLPIPPPDIASKTKQKDRDVR